MRVNADRIGIAPPAKPPTQTFRERFNELARMVAAGEDTDAYVAEMSADYGISEDQLLTEAEEQVAATRCPCCSH